MMEYRLVIEDEDGNEVGEINLQEYPTDNASRLAGQIDDLINTYEEVDEDEEEKGED